MNSYPHVRVVHLTLTQSANMTHTATETERCVLYRTSSPCFGDSTSPGFVDTVKEDFVCLDPLNSPPPSPVLSSFTSSPSSSPSSSLNGLIENVSSSKVGIFGLVFTSTSVAYACDCLSVTFRARRRSFVMQTNRLIVGLLH